MANRKHVRIVRQGAEAIDRRRSDHAEEDLDLREADLAGVDLRHADLSRADFSGADLRRADFRGAKLASAHLSNSDLREASLGAAKIPNAKLWRTDLQGANLNGALLFGADLREANLEGSELTGANLMQANISRASLKRADLQIVNFRSANLYRTNLERAVFGDSSIGNVDLSFAIGLEATEHRNASSLGVDTLYASRGQIPEVFLRGCGVPDDMIAFARSLAGAIQFFSCFISYSSSDKSFARRLHDALQGRGTRCWLDEHQILPGDDIRDAIDHGIRLYDKVLLCCSKTALENSWWVDDEIGKALTKEAEIRKDQGRKALALIPLDLDGYVFEWQGGKAQTLRERKIANFQGWESDNAKFEARLEDVVAALRSDAGARGVVPESKV